MINLVDSVSPEFRVQSPVPIFRLAFGGECHVSRGIIIWIKNLTAIAWHEFSTSTKFGVHIQSRV